VLTIDSLVQHLKQRLPLLTGERAPPCPGSKRCAGHRLSFGLLAAEQGLLRRLAVFTGSFDLTAVEGVCCWEASEKLELLDSLSSLVNKSMLMVEASRAGMRYWLLERCAYAREKLNDSGVTSTCTISMPLLPELAYQGGGI